jgi:hypothetical protein
MISTPLYIVSEGITLVRRAIAEDKRCTNEPTTILLLARSFATFRNNKHFNLARVEKTPSWSGTAKHRN